MPLKEILARLEAFKTEQVVKIQNLHRPVDLPAFPNGAPKNVTYYVKASATNADGSVGGPIYANGGGYGKNYVGDVKA